MRIKKNLFKPAVLLSAVCLFLAVGGTAEAAELLGIHGSVVDDLVDTSTIMLIDTALGRGRDAGRPAPPAQIRT